MLDPFVALDATAQAELVRRGEVQPIDLVEAAIARIERLNPTLNAVITPLFDRARAQASAAGLPAGPFRGVPLLLKDFLCHTAGDPYYEGMRFLRDLGWRDALDYHRMLLGFSLWQAITSREHTQLPGTARWATHPCHQRAVAVLLRMMRQNPGRPKETWDGTTGSTAR